MLVEIHVMPFDFTRLWRLPDMDVINASQHFRFLLLAACKTASVLHTTIGIISFEELISHLTAPEDHVGFQCFKVIRCQEDIEL